MKFTCTVVINASRDIVVQYFQKNEDLKEWQDGFVDKILLSGKPWETGTKSKMMYLNGKREMELIETIILNSLPEKFNAHYHHEHMDNTMTSYFTELSESQTQYEAVIEYTAFRGFIPKMLSFFPSFFKKQTQKWLDNFKVFVEKNSGNL